MNPLKTIAALLLAGAITTTQAQSIVERRGAPHAWGGQIVDQAGKPLQLTGMSFFHNIYGEGTPFYNKSVVNWLVKDWKCTVLRAAMTVSATGTYRSTNIMPVVDAAIANGVYVIIDWHEEKAVSHVAQAKAFFSSMAKKYGGYPNVIFEIYNEPHIDASTPTWDDIVVYADSIIPAIRQYSQNLIIVGTPNYDQYVEQVASNPLDTSIYPNIAYSLHFYANEPSHKLSASVGISAKSAVASGTPLFVTEWGTTSANGGQRTNKDKGAINTTESNNWVTFLNKNKISMCNWSISNKDEGASAILPNADPNGGWNDTDLTPSGKFVRNLIQTQCANDPTVCPWKGDTAGVFAIPGSVDLSQYSLNFGLSKSIPVAPSTAPGLTSVDSGDWAGYTVNTNISDTFEVRARVSGNTAGSTITIHTTSGDFTIPVQPSETPGTLTWAYSTNRVVIPAGQSVIEARFAGRGQNLLVLHQLEFVKNASRVLAAPGPIPADAYTLSLKLTGLVSLADEQTPFLSKMRSTGTAIYTVDIPQTGAYSFSANAASGSNGGALTVRITGGTIKTNIIQIPSTGGWTSWQSITSAFNLFQGQNVINILAAGDTGSLFSLSDLRISEGVSVLPRTRIQGLGLVRSANGLLLSLGDTKGFQTADLVSSDGRILSHTKIDGKSEIQLPLQASHLPLWIRLKGETTATLAVPPTR